MFSCVHPSAASSTATNGPKPDCMPARKKLSQSRPVRLVSDGDISSASDDAAMAMASILANALRHVQRLAQAATSVAVLIDPGNRRARIETTSQIGWFNLAEPSGY